MKIRLRKHHDDEYIDDIKILTPTELMAHVYLVPRYKTSDLSGDEWRFSAALKLYKDKHEIFHESFHSIEGALKHSPFFFLTQGKSLFGTGPVSLECYRKGHPLWKGQFESFELAAIGMSWHLTIAGETDRNYKVLSNEVERQHCQQPGCQAKPTITYQYKQYQIARHSSHMSDFEYDSKARHIWFCEKHRTRGDCGLEDCDDNYEIDTEMLFS